MAGLLGFGPLMAQDSSRQQPPAVWDLSACLSYAAKHNITINSLRLASQSGEQDLEQSKAARYPNLGASVTQSLTNYPASGLYPASGYGFSSQVTLYNGGYLLNDIKQKQLSLKAANLNVLSSQNDITLQITQAYLNILLAKENVVYLQDLINTTQAQVTQGQQRLDAGTLARKDLLELQALLANDKFTLVTGQNAVKQNILTLKQILQLPTDTAFEVSQADTMETKTLAAPLAQAQQTALDNRPEVKSGELGVQIAQIDIEKAKAGLRPTLGLGGSVFTNYSKNAQTYFPQLNDNFYQQLGLTLSVPIFDRKVTRTNVRRAEIATSQAQLNLQSTKLGLTQAIEQAYLNVQNAQSQFDAAKEQLSFTEETYRIANEQMKIGVFNTVDYLQQKNLYIQALQSYIQAKYATQLYTRIYNFYIGIPVTQ
jgi:outer membrane protein